MSSNHEGKPIHWRLLTTRVVTSSKKARRIVALYRRRWTIEEFFRTLKTAGFDIEEADIGEPDVMMKFVAAVAVATVMIMQLVRARDGTTEEKLTEAFDPDDKPVLEALSTQLEGATRLDRRTCGDYARVLFCFAREAADVPEHPAFPAPSDFRGDAFVMTRRRFVVRE